MINPYDVHLFDEWVPHPIHLENARISATHYLSEWDMLILLSILLLVEVLHAQVSRNCTPEKVHKLWSNGTETPSRSKSEHEGYTPEDLDSTTSALCLNASCQQSQYIEPHAKNAQISSRFSEFSA